MKKIFEIGIPTGLMAVVLLCVFSGSLQAQEEEPTDALLQMVVDLVSDEDPDMRTLGLQQVRDEAPGEAATKAFAELLPKLSTEAQVGLLDALGDRGDAIARPAALEMLKNDKEPVKAAALRALGSLGSAADVPLLIEKAATGSEPEKPAARGSLIGLRGDDVNAAIVSAMDGGKPEARVELLAVLAARNATESIQTVLKSAEDENAAVRLAAIKALRLLADEKQIAALVKIAKGAAADDERKAAEMALLVAFGPGRESKPTEVIAGLADADPAARIVLLHVLARAATAEALQAVVGELKNEDEAVADQAMRMLSIWRDPAAAPHLLEVAKTSDKPRHQVLAVRGLVRLASPAKEKPADVKMLAEAMGLAKRPQEKLLVLGVLGDAANAQSLALIIEAMDDPALAEVAALAAVAAAAKIEDGDKAQAKAAMEKVLQKAKGRWARTQADKILKSL